MYDVNINSKFKKNIHAMKLKNIIFRSITTVRMLLTVIVNTVRIITK